jgi:hypothetical protein
VSARIEFRAGSTSPSQFAQLIRTLPDAWAHPTGFKGSVASRTLVTAPWCRRVAPIPGVRGPAVPRLRYGAAMPDRLPLGVLVGGAPGSGKTTLAEALAIGLDLPVLHKDKLVHGRWRTLDRAIELGEPGVQPFFRSMELWIESGISFCCRADLLPQCERIRCGQTLGAAEHLGQRSLQERSLV